MTAPGSSSSSTLAPAPGSPRSGSSPATRSATRAAVPTASTTCAGSLEVRWSFDGGEALDPDARPRGGDDADDAAAGRVAASTVRVTIVATTDAGTAGLDYSPISEVSARRDASRRRAGLLAARVARRLRLDVGSARRRRARGAPVTVTTAGAVAPATTSTSRPTPTHRRRRTGVTRRHHRPPPPRPRRCIRRRRRTCCRCRPAWDQLRAHPRRLPGDGHLRRHGVRHPAALPGQRGGRAGPSRRRVDQAGQQPGAARRADRWPILGDDGVRYYLAHLAVDRRRGSSPAPTVTAGARLGEMGQHGRCRRVPRPLRDLAAVRRTRSGRSVAAWSGRGRTSTRGAHGGQRQPRSWRSSAGRLDHPGRLPPTATADPDAAISG